MTSPKPIIWISAHLWIEWQTELFIRRFDRSRPGPRNAVMGFLRSERDVVSITERLGFDPARMMASLFRRGLVKVREQAPLSNWKIHRQKLRRAKRGTITP